MSYFKSPMDQRLLDSLWNHYWVNTLSSSSLITNAEYTTGQVRETSFGPASPQSHITSIDSQVE